MKAIDLSKIYDFYEILELTEQFGIVEFAHILVSDLQDQLRMKILKFELNADEAMEPQIEIVAEKYGVEYQLISKRNQVYKLINTNQEFYWAKTANALDHLTKVSLDCLDCKYSEDYTYFQKLLEKIGATPNASYKKLLEISETINGKSLVSKSYSKVQSLLFSGDCGTNFEVTCLEDKYVFQNLSYGYSFYLSLWLGQAFFEKSLKSKIESM
jgi:hypothetical protein